MRIDQSDGPFVEGTNILEEISANEKELNRDADLFRRVHRGFSLIRNLDRHGLMPIPRDAYNLIPSDGSDSCRDILVVIVSGSNPLVANTMILEASHHVNARCPNTKHVIFWAWVWRADRWLNFKDGFNNCRVTLKLFGHPPIELC